MLQKSAAALSAAYRRWGFLVRRAGLYLLTAWFAVTLNYVIPRLMPGDPADAIIASLQQASGQQLQPATIESIRQLFGDSGEPQIVQYFNYLGQIAHLNLGLSISRYPTPVAEIIAQSLPWTLILVGISTVLGFTIGTGLGIVAGWRAGGKFDLVATPSSLALSAVPYFWLALVALYVFGFILGWFPLAGGYNPSTEIGFNLPFILSAIHYGALPAFTIIVASFGGWMLGMRNMMLTTTREDYVHLAGAEGLSRNRVVLHYAARNAMLPSLTGFALALGAVVGGSLLTEIVFSYPGIGYQLFDAVQKRDYPLIQGIFLIITISVLVANFIADSLYAVLDPRAR